MALWIQNVTPGGITGRPDDQPHDYVVRINDKELGRFQHVRALGAAACLRAAADAIDARGCGDDIRVDGNWQ